METISIFQFFSFFWSEAVKLYFSVMVVECQRKKSCSKNTNAIEMRWSKPRIHQQCRQINCYNWWATKICHISRVPWGCTCFDLPLQLLDMLLASNNIIEVMNRKILTAFHLKRLHKSKYFRCFCLDCEKQVGEMISPLCFDVLKLGRVNGIFWLFHKK